MSSNLAEGIFNNIINPFQEKHKQAIRKEKLDKFNRQHKTLQDDNIKEQSTQQPELIIDEQSTQQPIIHEQSTQQPELIIDEQSTQQP